MAERLIADKPVGAEAISSNVKCLPFPRHRSRATVLRAQRHVSHSIAALWPSLSHALLAARLSQCLCCGRVSANLLLRHSKNEVAEDVVGVFVAATALCLQVAACGLAALQRVQAASPSMSGRRMSSSIKSGSAVLAVAMPSFAFPGP
jgi:tRNA A37 threonylcarbamoyltransferase TsaD